MEKAMLEYKSQKRYISGVQFSVSCSKIQAPSADFIPQDLNSGSCGSYVYAIKKWTFNRDEAISEFAFIQNFQNPPTGFVKIDVDLNSGAGGSWNYLCFRKGTGAKVIDIKVVPFHTAFKSPLYGEWQVFPQDLNTGTKHIGKYIYLMYKTE